jgi:hypothetical protein
MSNEKENKQMNFWMFLDKNKYILIGFLLIVVLIILFRGYSIETEYFKIGRTPDTLYVEKEILLPPDTIFENKIITKYVETQKKDKTINVKKGDTIIEVNDQPANINTGSNSGVIGNNNTINSFGDKPIKLNESKKIELIRLINIELKELPKSKLAKINITGTLGNARSIKLAELIHKFLKEQGYNTGEDIFIAVFASSKKGVLISSNDNVIDIQIFMV